MLGLPVSSKTAVCQVDMVVGPWLDSLLLTPLHTETSHSAKAHLVYTRQLYDSHNFCFHFVNFCFLNVKNLCSLQTWVCSLWDRACSPTFMHCGVANVVDRASRWSMLGVGKLTAVRALLVNLSLYFWSVKCPIGGVRPQLSNHSLELQSSQTCNSQPWGT